MQISIDHLSMTYPTGKQALQDVTLSLESPSLVGLLGPNGAGKSTLMKLLVAGLLPTSGSIQVDRRPLLQCERELKAKLGYLPQTFGLYEELTVWQFLDYMAALKGIEDSTGAIARAIRDTNLEEKKKCRIRSLSGGNQQKVIIGRWLLTKPEVLLLDEPTRGIDVGAKYEIYQLILDLAKEGKGVIMVSSEMPELLGICDRILVMSGGVLAGEVDARNTSQEEILTLAAKYV